MPEALVQFFLSILDSIKENLVNKVVGWIINGAITFFSVKAATHHYYDGTKVLVSKGIMELELRSLLGLDHGEEIPDYAQAIFVKYGGRCLLPCKENHCKFLNRIRKTIAVVGGDKNEVSSFRPRNYGVLGVANLLRTPVIYDFTNKKLYQYLRGDIKELHVDKRDDGIYYKSSAEEVQLSGCETGRDVMMAFPLASKGRLVGGLTFDMLVGEKTIFQKMDSSEGQEMSTGKKDRNIKAVKEAMRASNILVNAYFKKKGDGCYD